MTDFDRESENRCSLAKNIIKRGWTDVDFANEIYAIIIKQVKILQTTPPLWKSFPANKDIF